MRRTWSILALALAACFVFAGCSSKPAEMTPDVIPASQTPNDADQGGGAGGTNDQNNDGEPDSTPGLDERVEDGMDDMKQDIEDGVDDAKDSVEEGIDDAKRGIENATDSVQDEMNRMKDDMTR